MEQITANVYVETQKRGSNPGFVVTSRGVIMIDAPVDPGDAKAWTKEIARRGKLLYLINTEHHLDHWVCNSLFDVDVISHELTRKTMLRVCPQALGDVALRGSGLHGDSQHLHGATVSGEG